MRHKGKYTSSKRDRSKRKEPKDRLLPTENIRTQEAVILELLEDDDEVAE